LLSERLRELSASPMQPDLNRSLRDVQALSDRCLGQIFAVAEADQHLFALVKTSEFAIESGATCRRRDLIVLVCNFLVDGGGGDWTRTSGGPRGLIADDVRQPAVEALGLTQAGARAPGAKQRLLGDVLGVIAMR
jgi:hypothetical protein